MHLLLELLQQGVQLAPHLGRRFWMPNPAIDKGARLLGFDDDYWGATPVPCGGTGRVDLARARKLLSKALRAFRFLAAAGGKPKVA